MNYTSRNTASNEDDYPLDWEDDELIDNEPRKLTEYEREAYAKDILLELFAYRRYCPADRMAQAIGGTFTGEDVMAICNEPERPIRTFTMRGKEYIELHPFVQKLVSGMEISS